MKGSVRQYRNVFFPVHKAGEKAAAVIKGRAQQERMAFGSTIEPGAKGSLRTVVLPMMTGEGMAV